MLVRNDPGDQAFDRVFVRVDFSTTLSISGFQKVSQSLSVGTIASHVIVPWN